MVLDSPGTPLWEAELPTPEPRPGQVGVGALEADQRVDEFGLAVALDTGDTHHLTGVDGEGDMVEHEPHGAALHLVHEQAR